MRSQQSTRLLPNPRNEGESLQCEALATQATKAANEAMLGRLYAWQRHR